jgi:hypothetical protein
MSSDEKEVKLAKGLAQKLAAIEDPSKPITNTVDQTVVSPFDEEKDRDLAKPQEVKNPEVVEPDVDYRQPDPLKHKYVSFIKSGFRIAAGFALALGYLQGAGLLLVLAEILGIAEEMV